jgi:hypothetical protein
LTGEFGMSYETSKIENTTKNFDAERMVQEIETGQYSKRRVDVSKDYQRSKEYAHSNGRSKGEAGSDISKTVPNKFLDMAKSMQPDRANKR